MEMEKEIYEKDHAAHYDTEDQNGRLVMNFRNINHTMRTLYEGRGSQKRILIIVLEEGTITQRRLTERLGIQPGSASEVIAKLERNGFIIRTENAVDRRTADITLTEQGRILAEDARKQRRARHEEMFSCLTGDERETLLELLEKVNRDWQQRYGSAAEHLRHGHGGGGRHFHGRETEGSDFQHHGMIQGGFYRHGMEGDNFQYGDMRGSGFHRHEKEESGFHCHEKEESGYHRHGKEESGFHRHDMDSDNFDRPGGGRMGGCDGNCQECPHPCGRGKSRQGASDGRGGRQYHGDGRR